MFHCWNTNYYVLVMGLFKQTLKGVLMCAFFYSLPVFSCTNPVSEFRVDLWQSNGGSINCYDASGVNLLYSTAQKALEVCAPSVGTTGATDLAAKQSAVAQCSGITFPCGNHEAALEPGGVYLDSINVRVNTVVWSNISPSTSSVTTCASNCEAGTNSNKSFNTHAPSVYCDGTCESESTGSESCIRNILLLALLVTSQRLVFYHQIHTSVLPLLELIFVSVLTMWGQRITALVLAVKWFAMELSLMVTVTR